MRNSYLPFLILLFVSSGCKIFESAIGFTDAPEDKAIKRMSESDDKKTARGQLSVSVQQSKKRTERLLILDVKIQNNSDFLVKDFVIECLVYGASGTQLEVKKQTVFDLLQPKQSKTIKELNFGLINNQMAKYGCQIDDFTLGNNQR